MRLTEGLFPIGAQYWMGAWNPVPEGDWRRDFERMRDLGFNTIRVWVVWADAEPEEGRLELGPVPGLLEEAARCGLKAVVTTVFDAAPGWAFEKFADAWITCMDGWRVPPQAIRSRPQGGWPGLCLHCPQVLEAVANFVRRTVGALKDSEAIVGWDVWNEPFLPTAPYDFGHERRNWQCFCSWTERAFREWLERKYRSPQALSRRWRRNVKSFDEISLPRSTECPVEWADFRRFMVESTAGQLRFLARAAREEDGRRPVLSHSSGSMLLGGWHEPARSCCDEWLMASEVDIYGLSSFVHEPVLHALMLDAHRCASKGKPFWLAELGGGPAKLSPDFPTEDMEVFLSLAVARNVKGILYWEWRDGTFGHLAPGFGLCDADGRPTERAERIRAFVKFLAKHGAELSEASMDEPEAAILVDRDAMLFESSYFGSASNMISSIRGLYKMLLHLGVGADFVHAQAGGTLEGKRLLFVPATPFLSQDAEDLIVNFVKRGGKVFVEAGWGVFGPDGAVRPKALGRALSTLLGCEQERLTLGAPQVEVERGPTGRALEALTFKGGLYRAELKPLDRAQVLGVDEGGRPIVVASENCVVLGTSLGASPEGASEGILGFLSDCLEWAGVEKLTKAPKASLVDVGVLRAREAVFVVVSNLSGEEADVERFVKGAVGDGARELVHDLRVECCEGDEGVLLRLRVPPKTGAVVRLRRR